MTDTVAPKYGANELKYVTKMLRGEDPDERSWPQRFEESFAEKLGVKYAIACNSGTSGLHMAMYAAGVSPGDEVISPALTVIMDAYAAIHLGAVPVFADVDPTTWNIDPEDVERKMSPDVTLPRPMNLPPPPPPGLPAVVDGECLK